MADPLVLEPLRCLGTIPIRIDWFGDVTYTSRRGGRSPRIAIAFSRPQNGKWVHQFGLDDRTPQSALVPVDFLRLLRIGDIWTLGQRVARDTDSIRLTFPDVLVDDSTSETRPSGLPVDDSKGPASSYLLPFAEFDAHRGHTGAFCIRIQYQDGVDLVVPCAEVVRFYFGSCGSLLNTLFSGASAIDRLYTSAVPPKVAGVANLTLAPGLPFMAATAVARIAFDEQARKAAAWIAKSGVAAAANQERFYPKTTFPFSGKTDLTVEGRWIHAHQCQVFLVERIVQCTHPFPFRRLYVRSSSEGSSTEIRPRTPPTSGSRSPAPPRSADKLLVEDLVARSLTANAILIGSDEEEPFPDLKNKSIHRMIEASGAGHGRKKPAKTPTELAAGQQMANCGLRGAEVMTAEEVQADSDVEPPEVATFRRAFGLLLERGETAASLVVPQAGKASDGRPFLRADKLLHEPDDRARTIWCAAIRQCDGNNLKSLVVLVRSGQATAAREVALALITAFPRPDEVRAVSLCEDFVKERLSEDIAVRSVSLGAETEEMLAPMLELLREGLSLLCR